MRRSSALLKLSALGLAAALAFAGGSGCDTVGQDLSDISKNFIPKTPGEAARDSMDPYDADKRREGTTLLANAPWGGAPAYLSAYRDKVDNERDPIVKAAAIRALGRHGEPSDAIRILPHLAHENVQVRWEAAKALQRLHNEIVVPDLLKTLANDAEHSDVRIAAAVALGQYPEDRVFQGLIAGINARELAVNMASKNSLVTLTGVDRGLDAAEWLTWYNGLAKPQDAFAHQQEYLYPTYSRDDTIWEKMAFWSHRNFETPAPPTGLRSKSERSTYDDDAAPAAAPATAPASGG